MNYKKDEKLNLNYKKISLETWKRAEIFQHFIDDVRCVISITANVDVTDLTVYCREKGYRFYPVFIYLVSKVVNSREEFRLGYDDNGELILWDEVSPSYIVFHPEDEAFTRLITSFDPELPVFYERVLADMELHRDKRGHEVVYEQRNAFDISCLPWLHYKTCDLHVYGSGTYLSPIITWGKYAEEGGRLVMPLTMQVHHAVADGFHVSRFYSDIQSRMDELAGGYFQTASGISALPAAASRNR